MSGVPAPAHYHLLPSDPQTICRTHCSDRSALFTHLWCSGAAPKQWGHHSAHLGMPAAPRYPAQRKQCCLLPLLLRGALLPSSEHLKMRVHFGKAILPCYSCCWLAFIKQHSYWCSSKTGVTFSPCLNQRSFLQPSSTQACLLSAYLGCSFLSGLHHFVLLLMKALALLLCHTSMLPQLTL